jgi:chemotaxis signal transduction protein
MAMKATNASGLDAVAARLDGLREEFDGSFAEPLRQHDAEHDELLAIRSGDRPYALRLAQTAGLFPDRPVTSLPGPQPALLGLAGFGGTTVPVYDLAVLLGHPVPEQPRWLVLADGVPPLALAFHGLDGHVRVLSAAILTEGHEGMGCLRGMVPLPGGIRPIVDIPAARTAVHLLTGHTDEKREA